MKQGDDLFGFICDRGEAIFRQGDRGDTMYIIQSGAVEVTQRQGEREVVLALLERGDFFGEMALIDDAPRSATVTALHRTRLLALTRTSLLARLREDPGVALHLLKTISQRIEKNNRSVKRRPSNADVPKPAADSGTAGERTAAAAPGMPAPAPGGEGTSRLDVPEASCLWFEPGQSIFRQGDPGDAMYIILEGEVDILQGAENNATVLARLGPNDFVGEMAIITNRPRTATARASVRSRLLPIRQNEFLEKIRTTPEIALTLLQTLIKRLRKTSLSVTTPHDHPSGPAPAGLSAFMIGSGRVRVALVSLSTCSGCASTLVDDHRALAALNERATIVYCPLLMDTHEIVEADIAVVDGLVRHREDQEKLEEVRAKSRSIVAWGTCAALGGIPAIANQFELEDLLEEAYGQAQDTFAYYLSGVRGVRQSSYRENDLALLRRAVKIDDVVKVDYYIPGCPPPAGQLIGLVQELRGEQPSAVKRPIVCAECSRKPQKTQVDDFWVFPRAEWEANQCFPARGAFCMGFLTRGGCGASCTAGGLPCWGCRGPSDAALQKVEGGDTMDHLILDALVRRSKLPEDHIGPLMHIIRSRANSAMNFYANHTIDRARIR